MINLFDKIQNRPYNEPRNKNVDEKSKFSGTSPERLWLVRIVVERKTENGL